MRVAFLEIEFTSEFRCLGFNRAYRANDSVVHCECTSHFLPYGRMTYGLAVVPRLPGIKEGLKNLIGEGKSHPDSNDNEKHY